MAKLGSGRPASLTSGSPQSLAGEGSSTPSLPTQNELVDSVCTSTSPQASGSSSLASVSTETTHDDATRDEAIHNDNDERDQSTSPPEPETPPLPTKQALSPSSSSQGHDTSSWRDKTRIIWSRLGWVVGFFGLLAAIAALPPAFKGQYTSQEGLDLALWTAKKDFIELCKAAADEQRTQSRTCEDALAAGLPPPPHVNFGVVARSLKKLANLNVRLTPKEGHVLFSMAKRELHAKLQTLRLSHSSVQLLQGPSKAVLSCFRSLSLVNVINGFQKRWQDLTQALESGGKHKENPATWIAYIRLGIIYTRQWTSHLTIVSARAAQRLSRAFASLMFGVASHGLGTSQTLFLSLWKRHLQVLEVLLFLFGLPKLLQRNYTSFQIQCLASSIVVAINEFVLLPRWCVSYCHCRKALVVVSTAACVAHCAYKEYGHFRPSVIHWTATALGVEYGLIVLLVAPFHRFSFSSLGFMVGTVGLLGIIYYDKRRLVNTSRFVSTSLGILVAEFCIIAYWDMIQPVLLPVCIALWWVGYALWMCGFIVLYLERGRTR